MKDGSGKNDKDRIISECPLESELEKFVMKNLPESKEAEILSHLECCFTCNELYQALASFYLRGSKNLKKKGVLPGMPAPFPRLFSEYIVNLEPDSLKQLPSENSGDAFQILSSLSSPDEKIKGSFLLSGDTGDVFAVIRIGQQYPMQYTPLQVTNLEGKFLTNSNGIALIGKYDPGLFLNASVKLFLPLLEITSRVGINREEEELFEFEPIPGFPIQSAQVYVDEDFALCMQLNFDGKEVSHPLSAVCVGRGKPRLVPVSKGVAVFEKAELGNPLHIFVYPL
ncbi:MAG: hypothetical protein ACE5OP_00320 [Candidatus Glassbacteria bacterium]